MARHIAINWFAHIWYGAVEVSMRAHQIIAVIVVLVIGLGAKQFLFPPNKAEANLNIPTASMNVLETQIDHSNALSVQKIHDMETVFSEDH
jgi:ABC-type phosphate transport system auxiliary subunit